MLQIGDTVRISKYDERNLQIEELREITNPRTKETRLDWAWDGYYPDIKSALKGVIHKYAFLAIEAQGTLDRLNELEELIKNLTRDKAKDLYDKAVANEEFSAS